MVNFLKGVYGEVSKVDWLEGKEVWSRFLQLVVIVFTVLIYFGVIDYLVGLVK